MQKKTRNSTSLIKEYNYWAKFEDSSEPSLSINASLKMKELAGDIREALKREKGKQ